MHTTCALVREGAARLLAVCLCAAAALAPASARANVILGDHLATSTPVEPVTWYQTICPASPALDVDYFTLRTDAGTDSVTKLQLAFNSSFHVKAVAAVAILGDDGTTVYGSATITTTPVTVTLTTPIPVDTTERQYRLRITPAGYITVNVYYPFAQVTGLTAVNSCTGTGCSGLTGDVTHNTLLFENRAASAPSSPTATTGPGTVQLGWTNSTTLFSKVVVLRSAPNATVQTSSLTNGATYVANQSVGADTVVYVGAGGGAGKPSTFTDYPPPGSTYAYRIFSLTPCGVYSTLHANVGSAVVPPPNTLVGDNLGAEPAAVSQACPASAVRDVDHFTLATTARTDAVTAVTLALANPAAVQRLSITSDDGLVEYGALDHPGATPVVTLAPPIPVTTTPTQYRVRVRPAGYGLAAGSYAVTATVTAVARTSTNAVVQGDATSGAVTVDRTAAGVTALSGRTGPSGAAALAWTNPPPPDFAKVVVLRSAPGGDVETAALAAGAVYAPGGAVGNDTVAYVGPVNSFADDASGTFRYRVFGADACLNYGAGADAGPLAAAPARSGSLGGRWGHVTYDAGARAVQGKTYDGTEGAFVEPTAGTDLGGTGISLYLDRAAPTRNEHLVGAVQAQTLHVQRWNGTSWSEDWSVYFGNKSYSGYYQNQWWYGPMMARRYDIAYLASGKAVVAYAKGDNLGPQLGYRTWDGVAWSDEAVITLPGLTGDVATVKLTARPGTDELALTVADATIVQFQVGPYPAGRLTTLFWDGSGWGDAPAAPHATYLYSYHSPGDTEPFDAAYESVTGRFMVFFSELRSRTTSYPKISTSYRRYDPATRSWQDPVSLNGDGLPECEWASAGETGMQLTAAADPHSNRILLAHGGCRQVTGVVWDGSAIAQRQQLSSYFAYATTRQKPLAAGWVTRAGASAAVVLWDSWDTGGITYSASVDGGRFSPAYAWGFGGARPGKKIWLEVDTDPDARDTLMVTFSDEGKNVWAKRVTWQGASSFSWYDADVGAPLGATAASSFRGFSFAHDLAPLTTVVGDGANPPDRPESAPLCPAPLGGPTALDAFTLRFTGHANTVTALTVSLAPGASAYVAKVEITDDAGAALGAVDYPTTDTFTIPLAAPLRVTGSAAQYGIRVTPRARPAMPGPPGASFALTGVVSGLTGLYANQTPGDAASARLVVDNQAPADPSWGTLVDGQVQGRAVLQDGQLTLRWTSSSSGVLLLRSTAPVADAPAVGELYGAQGTLGASTIVYAGPATSFADATVSPGATYWYRLFAVDPCGAYSPGVQLGPITVVPPLPAVASGSLSATLATCNQATLTATFTGDTDDDGVTRIERGASATGPWSTVDGCAALGGLGPRRCTDSGLPPGTFYYRATFTDPDGAPAPIVAGPLVATACAGLVLAPANPQPPGASMPAGSAGWTVGRLKLTAGGTIRVQSISIANAGTALAGRDLLPLVLVDEATGELLGTSAFDGAYHAFRDLDLVVSGTRTIKVVLAVANGATPGATFQLALAPAQVVPRAPAVASGELVAGNTFTIGAGPTAGGAAPGSPTVQIVNPMDGKLVSGSFKVQARVYAPAGLDQLASVAVTRDGWATSVPLTRNARYALPANAGMYEAVLPSGPGSSTLVARATDAAGRSALSTQVTVVHARTGRGDGNLLVRDNAAGLCTDCHALESHSSESTRSQYGSWSTTCRDCHAPHETSNIYLLRESIAPPPVNGYQAKRPVQFRARSGDSAGGTPSYVNTDRSGPCQVCHTRTQDRATGRARWRGAANLDEHYTASVGTQSCTSCHLHSAGFSADNPGRNDCTLCHNALLGEMQRTSGGGHHHHLSSGWSGTSAGSGATVYPTSPPGASPTDPNRRCLMCHVDHDLFLPDLNPGAGRGMNLRTDVAVVPAAPDVGLANTDFLATTGGICLSCHQASRAKAWPDPKGSVATLAVDRAGFAASAHAYPATSPFKGTGVAEFQANCSKCHTDRLAKRYQTDDVNRFGLHGADWIDSSTLCVSCHRTASEPLAGWPDKATDGEDLYGARTMTAPSTGIERTLGATWWPDDYPPGYDWQYYTPPATYRTKHEVGANPAAHQADREGKASNDGTLAGANRHVECADCHDPHRARPTGALRGTITAFTQGLQPQSLTTIASAYGVAMLPYLDTLADASAAWPVPNGLLGWTVKILSGPGAGTSSAIYGNTATTLTVKLAFPSVATGAPSAPVAGSTYVIVNNGALGAIDAGGPLQGAWGVEPAAWPAQPSPPEWRDGWGTDGQPFRNGDYTFRGQPVYSPVALARTETPSRSAAVCLKCHSSWAYGSAPPWSNNGLGAVKKWMNPSTFSSVQFNDFTIAGGPGAKNGASGCTSLLGAGSPLSPLVQASPMGCVAQSDVADEFNPNNLAHHAVFAPGRNQPIVASDTKPSVYNPQWPQFRSSPAGAAPNTLWVTTTGADNKVTLQGAGASWPVTTLPGWFLYLGSDAPAQNVAGWYQVTGVQSPTQLTVDRNPPARPGNTPFLLTPGLAATFVPPWGPWSTLKCTDCHASDDVGAPPGATDPLGPHGSGQKWLLRDLQARVYPNYQAPTGAAPWVSSGNEARSYQMISNTPIDANAVVIGKYDPVKTNFCLNCHRFEVYGDYGGVGSYVPNARPGDSRTQHPPGVGLHYGEPSPMAGASCRHCHGGARVGGIHGTNVGKGHASDRAGGELIAPSWSGKRFLNGSSLIGIRRPSKATAGTCYIKATEDSVNLCSYGHQGGQKTLSGATYDYEAGADP